MVCERWVSCDKKLVLTFTRGSVHPPKMTFVNTTMASVVVIIKLRASAFASGRCKLCANATAPLKPKKEDDVINTKINKFS